MPVPAFPRFSSTAAYLATPPTACKTCKLHGKHPRYAHTHVTRITHAVLATTIRARIAIARGAFAKLANEPSCKSR